MYSQYDEEKYILETHVAANARGRFLDIGGWHPTIFSNTRRLFELGWEGVIIEPSPGPFINLLRACVKCGDVPAEFYGERKGMMCLKCGGSRYGECDRLHLILAGVGIEGGLVKFHATDDAVSTSGEAEFKKWEKIGGYFGYFYSPIITLEQIANQFGGFDVVNFDAEGISVDLFHRAMALRWGPTCCIVEHDGRLAELLSSAVDYNAVYTNETNVVLVHK